MMSEKLRDILTVILSIKSYVNLDGKAKHTSIKKETYMKKKFTTNNMYTNDLEIATFHLLITFTFQSLSHVIFSLTTLKSQIDLYMVAFIHFHQFFSIQSTRASK